MCFIALLALLALLHSFSLLNCGVGAYQLDKLAPFDISIKVPHIVEAFIEGSNEIFSRGLPTGTCNDQTPCVNGACCSKV